MAPSTAYASADGAHDGVGARVDAPPEASVQIRIVGPRGSASPALDWEF
jgi:hypothetical protein